MKRQRLKLSAGISAGAAALALAVAGNVPAERSELCRNPSYLRAAAAHDSELSTVALPRRTAVGVIRRPGTPMVTAINCENPSDTAEYVAMVEDVSDQPVAEAPPEAPLLPADVSGSAGGQMGQDCVSMDPSHYDVGRTPDPPPPGGVTPAPGEVPPEDQPIVVSPPPSSGGGGGTIALPAAEADEAGPAYLPPVSTSSPGHREIARRRHRMAGATGRNGVINSTMGPGNIESIQEAVEVSDHARGAELVDTALSRLKAVNEAASSDRDTLSRFHRNATVEQAVGLLDRARGKLERAAGFLTEGEFAGAGAAETGRFRNYFLNARDRAETGARVLGEQLQKRAIQAQSPFVSLFGQNLAADARAAQALTDVFGARASLESDTSQDALINRMILFNSLTEQEQKEALDKLKLAETKKVVLQNGQTVLLPLLHNGYFFGGGQTSLDCSSFVSRVLPAEVRKGSFTTLDFRMMWLYGRSGKFPKPPVYKEDRRKLVMRTTEAFIPIDIYMGDRLQIGDLLVYRLPWKAAGHVFIVKSYDDRTKVARVIEAAQSAGTIRERDFHLSVEPMGQRHRKLRPGLFALRLKPVTNQVCTYKAAVKGHKGPPREGSKVKLGEGVAF